MLTSNDTLQAICTSGQVRKTEHTKKHLYPARMEYPPPSDDDGDPRMAISEVAVLRPSKAQVLPPIRQVRPRSPPEEALDHA